MSSPLPAVRQHGGGRQDDVLDYPETNQKHKRELQDLANTLGCKSWVGNTLECGSYSGTMASGVWRLPVWCSSAQMMNGRHEKDGDLTARLAATVVVSEKGSRGGSSMATVARETTMVRLRGNPIKS